MFSDTEMRKGKEQMCWKKGNYAERESRLHVKLQMNTEWSPTGAITPSLFMFLILLSEKGYQPSARVCWSTYSFNQSDPSLCIGILLCLCSNFTTAIYWRGGSYNRKKWNAIIRKHLHFYCKFPKYYCNGAHLYLMELISDTSKINWVK